MERADSMVGNIFFRRRKIGSRPISRGCLIASQEEGWIHRREFEICFLSNSLCHIPIRDACTWNSSWIETRNALLSRPSIPTADPSFRTGYMDYFRIFHESQVCCARTRDTEFAKLKLWRIVGYFFKHYEVGKLYFDLLFYRNFQNCVIR